MALSQNGWQGYTSYGDPALLPNPTVPGTSVRIMGGVARVAAPVLLYVAARFHREVEALAQNLGQWGYEPREIRGSTQLSNHASGTAIDLNASRHPLAASGTFSAAQVQAIRSILAACGGLVRWGGDYSGRKDEMHFEVVGSVAQIVALGARLATSVPIPTPTPTPAPSPSAPADWLSDATVDELRAAIVEAVR